MGDSRKSPVLLFYAYAREDEEIKDRLDSHLAVLKRKGLVDVSHDRKIGPGQEWDGEIAARLNTAHIILPLLSAYFFASDYCYNVEMAQALARQRSGEARVIPIILRPCQWQDTPFSGLQALPRDGKPVTQWPNEDEALDSVAEGIRMVLDEFGTSRVQAQRQESPDTGGSPVSQAIDAVRNAVPDEAVWVRAALCYIDQELEKQAPDMDDEELEVDEAVYQAIARSAPVVAAFASLADIIAVTRSSSSAKALYASFSYILDRYNPPRSFRGVDMPSRRDYWRFLGHELFVVMFSSLIREESWNVIADLLSSGIVVQNAGAGLPDAPSFEYVSEYLQSMAHRNARLQLRSLCLHADILKARHSEGELAQTVPMHRFIEADYLLCLRSILDSRTSIDRSLWRPWSAYHMASTDTPAFLLHGRYRQYVNGLMSALGAENVELLREAIAESRQYIQRLFPSVHTNPLRYYNTDQIATL